MYLANLFLIPSLCFCILELLKRIIYTRLRYVSVVYVHPITCYEGTEVGSRGVALFFPLTPALGGVKFPRYSSLLYQPVGMVTGGDS